MSEIKLNDTSKGILGEAYKKIGSYKEATGGGTPLEKGEKLEDHPEAHRVKQPRDEEGKFTYNSVNGKELEYGPSRGTTVPPFLRGIKLTFCQPGTKLKIEGEDGIKIKIMTIDMSVSEIVNACKKYIAAEGGFSGMGEGSSITKTGRKSASEKAAAVGQIGYKDVATMGDKTKEKIAFAQKKHESESKVGPTEYSVGGFKVKNDTLNPDGTTTKNTAERYHEWLKNRGLNRDNISISVPSSTLVSPEGERIKFDIRLASSNPEAFYNRYKLMVDSITEAFNEGVTDESQKISKDVVIDAIAAGEIDETIFEEEKQDEPVSPSGEKIEDNSEENKKASNIFGLDLK